MKKRYKLPDYCTVADFVMRELTAKDELKASMLADKAMDDGMRTSAVAAMGAEQREAMRLSLVSVDGVEVNKEHPYFEMDNWSLKTIRFLQMAFNDLNGVETDDLKNFTAGAEILDLGDSPLSQDTTHVENAFGKSG